MGDKAVRGWGSLPQKQQVLGGRHGGPSFAGQSIKVKFKTESLVQDMGNPGRRREKQATRGWLSEDSNLGCLAVITQTVVAGKPGLQHFP